MTAGGKRFDWAGEATRDASCLYECCSVHSVTDPSRLNFGKDTGVYKHIQLQVVCPSIYSRGTRFEPQTVYTAFWLKCTEGSAWLCRQWIGTDLQYVASFKPLICAFSNREKKRLLTLLCLSVCPSACNNSSPTVLNITRFGIWVFFENLSRKFKCH